jgi:protein TonB
MPERADLVRVTTAGSFAEQEAARIARSAEAALPILRGREDRPAPYLPPRQEHWPLIGLLICSVLLHANLVGVFTTAPEQLPSIGIPAISVEIVIGDDAPAGVAAAPGEEGVQAKHAVTLNESATETLEEAVSTSSSRRSEPPQTVEEAAEEPARTIALGAPRQEPSTAPEPLSAAPVPEPADTDVQPKVQDIEPPSKQPAPPRAPAAQSASGIGRGRSSPDANYSARVAAHLARHKQFPEEARRRRQQGSASVAFNIDGAGRVTDVRLVGSAGSALLDREAQAMVRRASLFPPPPGGQPQTFSVPVSFTMR